MKDVDKFWIENSDEKILLTIHQYFFSNYKYNVSQVNKIPLKFVRYLYYVTIGIEELIDNTWEDFKNSQFHNDDFFKAIHFFNSKLSVEIIKRMENQDLYDRTDQVTDYIIKQKEILNLDVAEALRYRRLEIEHLVPELIVLAKRNRENFEKVRIERWKKDPF